MPGFHPLQYRRSNEPPDHGSAPVKGDEPGRNFFSQAADLRLAEIIHQKTPDRNLGPDIYENGNRAKDQVRMPPDGVVYLLADAALRVLRSDTTAFALIVEAKAHQPQR